MELDIKKNMYGGDGEVYLYHILDDEQKNGMLRIYARAIVQPHSSIGFHTHHGDSESYYVLSGEGLYNNGHETYKIKKGDTTFCKDGESHGLVNESDEPLEMMALIIYTNQNK